MSTSPLIGLALLKVNWDTLGRDYVENFVLLVVESLHRARDDVVSLPNLQASLESDLGLSLPLNPLRQVLHRAAKRRYVRKQVGVFYRDFHRCEETQFADLQRKVHVIHSDLVDKLRSFFATDNHGEEWSPEEADQALQDFLAEDSLSLLYSLG